MGDAGMYILNSWSKYLHLFIYAIYKQLFQETHSLLV